MNSPHQREQLPDLLSDALDATQRARVESHLRECAQCARELRELEQMQAAVAALPAAPVPISVRANVRAQLREKPRHTFALPFAFPLKTSQLAWGGAVVGAVGLMLLGRPSLQNDAYSPAAPVSETEMAASAARPDSALQDKATAAKAPQPRASAGAVTSKKAASAKPAPGVDVNGKAPTAMEPLPPLPAPPASVKPRLDSPGGAQPSFAFPQAPAPLSPPKIDRWKSRPVAPGASALEPKSNLRDKDGTAKSAGGTMKNAPHAPEEMEKPAPKSPADTSSQENLMSRAGKITAPIVAPPAPIEAPSTSFSNGAASSAGNDAAPEAPRRAKMIPESGRIAPPLAPSNRVGESSTADAALATRSDIAKWPGGAVKATLGPRAQTEARGGNPNTKQNVQSFAPPPKFPFVLTFSVAQPIGKARLILLGPGGEQTIWRGELKALPAQVELSQATIEKANGKRGQTIRARLEQIGADDNPTSSSTFELLVP